MKPVGVSYSNIEKQLFYTVQINYFYWAVEPG